MAAAKTDKKIKGDNMPRFLAIFTCILCVALPASAQESIRALTPQAVENFILSMTEKTRPGGPLSDERATAYLNKHLFDAGTYSSDVTFMIPHHHPQTRSINLDKPQFIGNVIAGRQATRNHKSSVSIEDIKITEGTKEATFKTITNESGEMPMEGQYIAYTGKTECIQKLALDGTVPVILSAKCESVMRFQE